LAGGQVVEDIQDFGRNSELIASLQNDHVRDNDDIQGFGGRFDSDDIRKLDDLPLIGTTNDEKNTYRRTYIRPKQLSLLPAIQPGDSKVVNFRPLCGLLHQSHHLPLKFVPITLELELADKLDPIITPLDYDGASTWQTTLTDENTVSTWQIQNACLKCDILTIDNALNNSFIEHLVSGKSLPLKYQTFISQQSSVVGTNFSVQVIRAVTKLQKAFITFYKPVTNVANSEPFR
jgi:hypothetical protein